jgi:NAD(P)-dependent dehydrogenase (short-subunit alcohol dehydrogenase family)
MSPTNQQDHNSVDTGRVDPQQGKIFLNGRALQRARLPQDVDGLVLFLLSDASPFSTGQLLAANGGFVVN